MACPSPELAELIAQQMREVDEFLRRSRLQRLALLALEEWRPWLSPPDEAGWREISYARMAARLSSLDTLTSEVLSPHLWLRRGVAAERCPLTPEVQRPVSECVVRRCFLSRVMRRLLRADP